MSCHAMLWVRDTRRPYNAPGSKNPPHAFQRWDNECARLLASQGASAQGQPTPWAEQGGGITQHLKPRKRERGDVYVGSYMEARGHAQPQRV